MMGGKSEKFEISISQPDSMRFGFICVRANGLAARDVAQSLAYCRQHNARVLFARCDTGDYDTIEALEALGFLLKDTLVYYESALDGSRLRSGKSATAIRVAVTSESEKVGGVAKEAFSDYFSHYHADQRFDEGKVQEAFVDWARRCCSLPSVADAVLVAEERGEFTGFAALRLNTAEEGDGVLFGVHPSYRRRGIFRDLLIASMDWISTHGRSRMTYSTQINNYTVQRVLVQCGFSLYQATYTFHKWFD